MLPIEFKPKNNFQLIRLGRKYDGGYLVDEKSIIDSEFLISGGMFWDFKFEQDYINLTKNKVYCYDHQINPAHFITTWFLILMKRIFLFNNFSRIKKAFNNMMKPFKFKKFIKNEKVNYFKLGIGLDYENIISLEIILKKISLDKKYFLKLDIEGDEYRVLDDIVKYSKNLNGLVVEFHNVDLHKQRIIKFINDLPLQLIYIHPNNAAPLNADEDPTIIEMTFSENPSILNNLDFEKHELDMPNVYTKKDIILKFQ